MSILVVGSVAFDTLTTPSGQRKKILGGAATYFSLAASFFTEVRVVGVVGTDFTPEHEAVLVSKGIDTSGIEHAEGLSFHWTGSYEGAMNEAKTLSTDLNVFATFAPKIPDSYKDADYLFLANIDPVLQLRVRQQMPNVKLVAGDTMNYWINDHRDNLNAVLRELDVLLINDGEARLISGETNLVKAAHGVMALGPRALVIKHGEYGATAFFSEHAMTQAASEKQPGTVEQRGKTEQRSETVPFRAPALPIEIVVDPTGAGDSFAGGFYGYIASQPALTPAIFRRALFYGGVMGSFAVEQFGTERLQSLTRDAIETRFQQFLAISHLEIEAS